MKENENYDEKMKTISKIVPVNEEKLARSRSKTSLLKKTVVTSVVSLALLGAGQVSMHALLSGGDSSVQAQTRNSDDRALEAYFRRGFNYVDAKILAGYWGGGIGEAKVRFGNKLLNLRPNQAMAFIREARGLALEKSRFSSGRGYGYVNFPINYTDGGYQYRDAEALSKYWKQDIGETKLLMETLLISGKDGAIKNALRNARG